MTKHKWHDEIVAWAGGSEIEVLAGGAWFPTDYPAWHDDDDEFRIKPQPKDCDYISIAKEHYANLRKYEKKLREEVCVKVMNDFMDNIKPQPKEKKYLYIYERRGCETVELYINTPHIREPLQLFGKIEVLDD